MTAADSSVNSDEVNDGGGFGVYLKTQREARGISLKMIAERTYIQPEILLYIETERLDQLPEPVYIKGFVRAYAEAIGIDPVEAVLRYERHHAAFQQALSARQLRGRQRKIQRMVLAVVLLSGLVLVILRLMPDAPKKADLAATPPPRTPGPAAPGMQADPPAQATSAEKATRTPLLLRAVGLRESTLKIIVDGKRPKVYRLQADTRLEIEAERDFNILIEDARAVSLYLNDEAVPVQGREGQQVTLQLP
jgi:cytoskeletal protein RodZ